jgi:hypothetical protein
LSNPEEYISYRGELSGKHPLYYANMETNITGIHPHLKGQMVLDLTKPYFRMYVVTGRGKATYMSTGCNISRQFIILFTSFSQKKIVHGLPSFSSM